MADTKKEHYVPQCYLQNFANSQRRIDVFDKWKLSVRKNQDIVNVAMENRFYDIDLYGLMNKLDTDVYNKLKTDLMRIVKTDKWEDVDKFIGNKKYIEKQVFGPIEGIYSEVLRDLIAKSYGGNEWVIGHCNAMSDSDKLLMSYFIAVQVIRTKSFRNTIEDIFTGTAQTLAYKMQEDNENKLPKEAFAIKAPDEFIRLQHSMMILNPEYDEGLTEILYNKIWVMMINKTNIPFYTSDNPVVRIPHKENQYVSYSGFNSEGIEIAFPISPKLMLCICDPNTYGAIFKDRQFHVIKDSEEIKFYNSHQILKSYRCVFCADNDFEDAKAYCLKYPELQQYQSEVEVT